LCRLTDLPPRLIHILLNVEDVALGLSTTHELAI